MDSNNVADFNARSGARGPNAAGNNAYNKDVNDFNDNVIAEFRANGGMVGGSFANTPMLLLTTIGARSGQPRTTPVCHTNDNDRIVIVASKADAPTNPDWYDNLLANPVATVELGAETFQARALVIEGKERSASTTGRRRRCPVTPSISRRPPARSPSWSWNGSPEAVYCPEASENPPHQYRTGNAMRGLKQPSEANHMPVPLSSVSGGAELPAVPQLIEHLCRHQAGQVVATLTRIFGPQHLDLAEDVVQETLITALQQWSYRAIPENPAGWIMTVARNQALDILRRERRFRDRQTALVAFSEERNNDPAALVALSDDMLRDDLLRMMFICCHPAIAREAQVALTLKTLGGFGVAEIAHAFLAPEATIAQRLVRAKRTIRAQHIPYAVPDAADLPTRLDAVLDALYLLFNEGYSASHGDALVRHDLCVEAIRLTAILAAHPAGDQPKVHALLALMLLHTARLPARTDAAGDFLLLETQDRALWDRAMIHAGLQALIRSASGDALTAYHLQAGIAACHAVAPSYAATDWPRILSQYDALMTVAPSPVVALNRAVAVAMVHGPAAGLAVLDAVRTMPGMASYALLHATIGELRQRLGTIAAAIAAYDAALALTLTEPERRFLRRKRAAITARCVNATLPMP